VEAEADLVAEISSMFLEVAGDHGELRRGATCRTLLL
jgi:hypothetical protein